MWYLRTYGRLTINAVLETGRLEPNAYCLLVVPTGFEPALPP